MRILAATDGSDAANRAVELAAKLTKEGKGQLKIVHIVSELTPDQLKEYALSEHVTSAEAVGALSDEKLRVARERAEAAGVSDVETESRSESEQGDIAGSIIDAARRDKMDMIVLGKRGLGRLSGLILGSVSQKVVSVAHCPVIVVP